MMIDPGDMALAPHEIKGNPTDQLAHRPCCVKLTAVQLSTCSSYFVPSNLINGETDPSVKTAAAKQPTAYKHKCRAIALNCVVCIYFIKLTLNS